MRSPQKAYWALDGGSQNPIIYYEAVAGVPSV